MTINVVRLRNLAHRLEQAVESLRKEGDTFRAKRGEYAASEILADDYRRQLIEEARTSSLAAIERHRAEALAAKAELDQALKEAEAEAAPTGVEGIAVRVEGADARQRVRALLDRGTDPHDILRRATEQADRTTLEALRVEAAWLHPSQGGGLTGEPSFDPDGFVRQVDRALIPLLPDDHAEVKQTALELAATWPIVEVVLETAAALDSGPNLADAIAMRAAQQQANHDLDGRPPERVELMHADQMGTPA